MRYGDIVGIDVIRRFYACRIFGKMRDYLMPVEVEVDPAVGTSALSTAKYAAVKFTGGLQVVYGKSKVKKVA